MDVPWKVIFAFLGVFVAGTIFGGVFTIGVTARRFNAPVRQAPWPERAHVPAPQTGAATPAVGGTVTPSPAPLRTNSVTLQLMTQFTRRLSPTPEQRDEFRRILGRAGEDLQRLRQEHVADVARVTERMYADISGVLTLDQRSELERMRRQTEERFLADRKRREEAAAAEKAEKGGKAGGGKAGVPKAP